MIVDRVDRGHNCIVVTVTILMFNHCCRRQYDYEDSHHDKLIIIVISYNWIELTINIYLRNKSRES